MGFFSWNTSDTKKSIANRYSSKETFKVHLITRDGQVYTEDDYEGYGLFGGIDYYEVMAIINGLNKTPLKINEEMRDRGINLMFRSGVRNKETKQEFVSGGVDFFDWQNDIVEDELSANKLLDRGTHEMFKDTLEDLIDSGVQFPKLVENLPCSPNDELWAEEFDKLPISTQCEFQGYFY
jgi:hypothetical protein